MTSEELLGALSPVEQVNAPKHLFLSGDTSLLSSGPRVAIVGTNRPTVNALGVAGEFASDLVERGVVVVSGVMPGIENAAHRQQAGLTPVPSGSLRLWRKPVKPFGEDELGREAAQDSKHNEKGPAASTRV